MDETKQERGHRETRWVVVKYRLTMALVVLLLLGLVFMMIDGAVINFQCSFWDFVTAKCNRWDAAFKPWS